MSVPRSIGWAVFRKGGVCSMRNRIYATRNAAIAAYYQDGSWNYLNQGLSPADIKAARQAKVLQRYDIKEVFIND